MGNGMYSKREFVKQILMQVNMHLEGVRLGERPEALRELEREISSWAKEYDGEGYDGEEE